MGSAFVYGGLQKGAILAAKHFAFNTQESFREGLVQFMEEQSAREKELRAFQGLSEDVRYVNGADNEIGALGLMSSFSRIGVYGVNSHTGLMKNILRGEWGFKGLISTDMVVGGNFFNPQDSIINNVTFMATSNAENLLSSYWKDYNNKSKVKSDPNMVEALYENMHYYMYSLANSLALNGIGNDTVIEANAKSYWEYVLTGCAAGFGAAAFVLAVCSNIVGNKKNKGGEDDA
jgi:beta-glucosidase